jgi:hypothetical protein
MSSLTTTSINTVNGTTNLTLGTGNTSGPAIIVSTGNTITLRANSTANVIIANSSTITANGALVVTGSSTLVGLTATTMNLGTPSIATTGHSRLPNGLLIQWGAVSVNATAGNITFPTAFTVNPYSIQVTGVSTAAANMAAVTAVSTTTANVRSTSTAAASTVYYLAIGV